MKKILIAFIFLFGAQIAFAQQVTITNSTINGIHYVLFTGISGQIPSITGTSTISNSILSSSTIDNSIISSSTISTSTIENSTITNSVISSSTISNDFIASSSVDNQVVDGTPVPIIHHHSGRRTVPTEPILSGMVTIDEINQLGIAGYINGVLIEPTNARINI